MSTRSSPSMPTRVGHIWQRGVFAQSWCCKRCKRTIHHEGSAPSRGLKVYDFVSDKALSCEEAIVADLMRA